LAESDKFHTNVGMELFDWRTLEVPTQSIECLDLLGHGFHHDGEASFWNNYYTTLGVSPYLL